jgi:hypothetical protein
MILCIARPWLSSFHVANDHDWRETMTELQLRSICKRLRIDQPCEFRSWINANAIFGLLVLVAFIAMAVAGAWSADSGLLGPLLEQALVQDR